MKFSFFYQRHALSTSFDIFVVTYRVTNFLLKLIDMLLFSAEKTDFPCFEIPYFRVLPFPARHFYGGFPFGLWVKSRRKKNRPQIEWTSIPAYILRYEEAIAPVGSNSRMNWSAIRPELPINGHACVVL